ncbi:MAG TPA: hypothetical protein ENL46_03705, partial [Candidatus Aminicenantes bacterium]|nr:hypothetical protein [Candidatus Aminicenantes bacterium]
MNHDEIKKLISAYHDGELPEKKMEEVRKHIESCPECHRDLDTFQHIDRISSEIPKEEPNSHYWEKMLAHIRSEISDKKSISPLKETKMYKDS